MREGAHNDGCGLDEHVDGVDKRVDCIDRRMDAVDAVYNVDSEDARGWKWGATVAALALALALAGATAAYGQNTYNAGDIQFINTLIANNNLMWTPAAPDDGTVVPGEWLVVWSSEGSDKRIIYLNLNNQWITGAVDFSPLTGLKDLELSYNYLTGLTVSGCTMLEGLLCDNNRLARVDLSANTLLMDFRGDEQKLDTVPMYPTQTTGSPTFMAYIMYLGDDIQIPNLNTANNPYANDYRAGIVSFTGSYTLMGTIKSVSFFTETGRPGYQVKGKIGLDIKSTAMNYNMQDMAEINRIIDENTISDLTKADQTQLNGGTALPTNWYIIYLQWSSASTNKRLNQFTFYSKSMTGALDLSYLTALTLVDCSSNSLTALNVNGLTALGSISCDGNQLTDLDVTTNTALQILSCYSNLLKYLDLANNAALSALSCQNNQIEEMFMPTAGTQFSSFNCSYNKILILDMSNCTMKATGTFDGTGQTATANLYLTETPGKYESVIRLPRSYAFGGWGISFDSGTGKIVSEDNTTTTSIYTGETGISLRQVSGDITFTYNDAPEYHPDDIALINEMIRQKVLTGWSRAVPADGSYVPDDWTRAGWSDAQNFKRLVSLDLSGLGWTSLPDLSGFVGLDTLNISNNPFTSLDLSALTTLKSLNVSATGLQGTYDFSALTALEDLDVSSNALLSIDLKKNTALTTFYGAGQYDTIKFYPASVYTTGPYEYYVGADSVTNLASGLTYGYLRIKASDSSVGATSFRSSTGRTGMTLSGNLKLEYSTTVPSYNIGDVNIVNRIISSLSPLQTDTEGTVQLATAEQLRTGSSIPSTWLADCTDSIGDQKGTYAITVWTPGENAKRIMYLVIQGQNATGMVDVRGLDVMEQLRIDDNDISEVILGEQPKLYNIFTSNNANLSAIDVSQCPALKYLTCYECSLTKLDLSCNTELLNVYCYSNQLTSLTGLAASSAKLTRLDCHSNLLTELDLTADTALEFIRCTYNKLTYLDLSKCTKLTFPTSPPSLYLKGQTPSRTLYKNAAGKYVTKIKLNSPAYTGSTVTYSDGQLISNDKNYVSWDFTVETGFSGAQMIGTMTLTYSDDPPPYAPEDIAAINSLIMNNGLQWPMASPDDGSYAPAEWTGVTWSGAATGKRIISLNISGKNVSGRADLTALTAMTTLDVSNNALVWLNLKKNEALTTFNGAGQTVALTMWPTGSGGTAPYESYIGADSVTNLSGGLTYSARRIQASDNSVTSSNFRSTTGRAGMALTGTLNPITYKTTTPLYNIGDMIVMNELIRNHSAGWTLATDAQLADGMSIPDDWDMKWSGDSENMRVQMYESDVLTGDVDISGWTEAMGIILDGCPMTSLNLSDMTWLSSFSALPANNLTSVNTTNCISLLDFLIDNAPLFSSIDISTNTALENLQISSTGITSLDCSNNTSLISLDCQNGKLTELDVTNNTALTTLNCYGNKLTSLDLTNNTALSTVNAASQSPSRTMYLTDGEGYVGYVTFYEKPQDLNSNLTYDAQSGKLTAQDKTVVSTAMTQGTGNAAGTLSGTLTLTYSDEPPLYNIGDIMAINKIIAKNGLGWTKAIPDDGSYVPGDWTGVTWSAVAYNRRIIALDVSGEGLYGSPDFSNLTAMTTLDVSNNKLLYINLKKNTALTTFSGSGQTADIAPYPTGSGGTAPFEYYVGADSVTNLQGGLTYANKRIKANTASPATSTFRSTTGKAGMALAGTLNIDYTTFGSTTPYYNIGDMKVMNELIRNNSAGWTLATDAQLADGSSIPSDWSSSILVWTGSSENLRVQLYQSTALTGDVDISGWSAATWLSLDNSPMTSLNISDMTVLSSFTAMPAPNLALIKNTNCTALSDFRVNNAPLLTSVDVSTNTALYILIFTSTGITSLDCSNNTSLITLNVGNNNNLAQLDVPKSTSLISLFCQNGKLTELDVTNNTALTTLNCYGNKLTSLDLSNNTALSTVNAANQSPFRTMYLTEGEGYVGYVTFYEKPSDLNSNLTYDAQNGKLTAQDKTVVSTAMTQGTGNAAGTLSGTLTLTYSDEPPLYNIGDIMAINKMIANNGLPWTKAAPSDGSYCPADWTGVTWSGAALGKRITALNISGLGVYGDVDVSGLTAMTALDVSGNKLVYLNLKKNTALTTFSGGGQTADIAPYPTGSGGTAPFEYYVGADSVTNLQGGLTYANKRIKANTASPATSTFRSTTGKAGMALAGTLNIDYTTFGSTTPYYNIGDMKVMNELIRNNSAGWTLATDAQLADGSSIPSDWSMSWSSGSENLRVVTYNSAVLTGDVDISGWSEAVYIYTELCPLTSLNVSNLTKMTMLYADGCPNMVSIDVTNCISLRDFRLQNSPITSIDLSTNTALRTFLNEKSNISSIDLSHNTLLTTLGLENNSLLTALDLSHQTALASLTCQNCLLSELDLSANTALSYLKCYGNKLTSLDLSNNTALSTVDATSQKPSRTMYLTEGEGYVGYVTFYETPSDLNPNLTYDAQNGKLTAQDKTVVSTAMTQGTGNAAGTLSGTLTLTYSDEPPLYNIGDIMAINKMIANNGLPWSKAAPSDGSYCPADWTGVTWSGEATGKRIISLNISGLNVHGDVDVSGLTAMTTLDVSNNKLLYINLKKNTALTTFSGGGQTVPLQMWPTGSGGTAPYEYYVGADSVTELQGGLTYANKRIKSATNSPSASTFRSTTGKVGMTLSGNLNPITYGSTTPLYNIGDMKVMNELIRNNSAGWTLATDAQLADGMSIPSDWDGSKLYWLSGTENMRVSAYNCATLTGDADFTGWSEATQVEISNSPLTSVNASNMAKLKRLTMQPCTSLVAIDVKNSIALGDLRISHSKLTSIDVSTNVALKYFYLISNKLTSIDISHNTALIYFDITSNQLTSLDLTANTLLTSLTCNNNQLTSLDVSANTALTTLNCASNQLTSLDVSANTVLTTLNCKYNLMTELDLTNNTALTAETNNSGQTPPLTMYFIPSTGKYVAPIALNQPTLPLPTDFSYDDGILKADNNNHSTMAFTVQTNLTNFTLSGNLQLTYTVDSIPPTLTVGEVTNITDSRATLNFTVSEAGKVYCLVLAPTDPIPSANDIKAQGAALAKGTGAVVAGDNKFIIKGLSASSGYKAYIVMEDMGENLSSVGVLAFTTLAPIPVGIESSAATVAGGVTAGDVVYFGRYPQTLITDLTGLTEYVDYMKYDGNAYRIEPVAWRALENAGGRLLLLADKGLYSLPYYNQGNGTWWEESDARTWLNTMFIYDAFTANEQTALMSVTNQNSNASGTAQDPTVEQVFLLSFNEVRQTSYGFSSGVSSSPSRVATVTDYAAAKGATAMWWLRTTTADSLKASAVSGSSGEIYPNMLPVNTENVAIRPAISIDASVAGFTSDASGLGAKSYVEIGEIKKAAASAKNVKLTVTAPSSDLSLTISDTSPVVGVNGQTLTFNYSNAVEGEGKTVSMALMNTADSVLFYGRLADCSIAGSASGTVSIPLTMFLTPGSYNIRLFEEQVNEDGMTDYTSAPVDIPMTFSPVYNITYDLNGGTLGTANIATYVPSMTADIPIDNSPILTNYGFGGWLFTSDEPDVPSWLGKAIVKGAYGNLTAVAQWDTIRAVVDSVFIYNGAAQEPDAEDLIVYCGDSVMTAGTDYSCVFSNNTAAGWAYIHINTGASGRFTGTPTDSFAILPRKLEGTWSVTPKPYQAGDRKATVTFSPDNKILGEDVTVNADSAMFATSLVDSNIVVTIYNPITLSGAAAANYSAPDTAIVLGKIYPWRFIHAGHYTDGWCWDGYAQTTVLPATDNDLLVSIEDDCYMDSPLVGIGTLQVAAGKSFTIAPGTELKVYTGLQLHSGASFVNLGTFKSNQKSYCTYIDTLAAGRNWYLSSPVINWNFSASLSPLGTPGGKLTVAQYYTEAKHLWIDISKTLDPGVGMVIQSDTLLNVQFNGELQFDDVKVKLTNTTPDSKHGFNLVGNPFPAYWRFKASTVEAAGIYATMWYRAYTPHLGYEFVAFNANGTVAAAPGWENASTSAELGFVPPMQSFWVRMQDDVKSGTFIFDYASVFATGYGNRLRSSSFTESQDFQDFQVEDLRGSESDASLRGAESVPAIGTGEEEDNEATDYTPPVIDVLVRIDVAKIDTTAADQMVIYATKNAKQDFDDFDSEKMTDGADRIRLYTKAKDLLSTGQTIERELCIDGRPVIKVGDVIPIVFWASYANEFMLRVSEFRGCDTLAVWLVDHLANKEFKLNGGGIYYFSSRSGEIADRFTLEFRQAPVGNEVVSNDSFFAWCSSPGVISVRGASAGEKVEVYNVLGRLLRTSSDIDGIAGFAEFTGLEQGIYLVRCKNESLKVIVRN